jgi:N-acetylneuraminate synthase
MSNLFIGTREVGPNRPPLVIAEIGINHNGSFEKAVQMIDDANEVGCECVKFQSHVLSDEMVPVAKEVIPGNSKESIWDIIKRCSLSEGEESRLKKYTESRKMSYLCTPFSRAATDRLSKLNVSAYKIGSGECNNYPLVDYISRNGKPVLLSTGMNNIHTIQPSVEIFRKYSVPFALMHCTSIYPTPYEDVHLKALKQFQETFPDAILGLSDHSMGIYTALASIALGACIIEKHFVSDKAWAGPDVSISLNPEELKDLIIGVDAVYRSLGGAKRILSGEKPTIMFAYASVVATRKILTGEKFSADNVWVKRPGTGEIRAHEYDRVIGKKAKQDIDSGLQLKWSEIE